MHDLNKGDFMAYNTYTLRLTPDNRNMASDGSLDTAVMMHTDGPTSGQLCSIQRTGYITTTPSGFPQQVKVGEHSDCTVFTDAPQGQLEFTGVQD